MKKEQYLCPECAAKYTAFDGDAPGMTPGSLLAGLLTSVLGQAGIAREDDSKKTNLACKNCKMTYNEFLKYSKFGCSECVHTFGFLLDDYLKKIQGSSEHSGKVYPGRETVFVPEVSFVGKASSVSEKNKADSAGAGEQQNSAADVPNPASAVAAGDSGAVTALKRQLAAAIKAEEYEEAARIRDAIKNQKAAEQAEAQTQEDAKKQAEAQNQEDAKKQAEAQKREASDITAAGQQNAVMSDSAASDGQKAETSGTAATGML